MEVAVIKAKSIYEITLQFKESNYDKDSFPMSYLNKNNKMGNNLKMYTIIITEIFPYKNQANM